MYFPKYWAQGSWSGKTRTGDEIETIAWGWSDQSAEDAKQRGVERARKAAQAAGREKKDSYSYGSTPLREEILQLIAQEPVHAAITRNRYGCEVLNTEKMVMIDVDTPYQEKPSGFFASLFGKKSPAMNPKEEAEASKLDLLQSWISRNPGYGFRVYRTAAGLRYILTTHLATPEEQLTQTLLNSLESDPCYKNLCRLQKSFRARLTPKPWRCGVENPPQVFPLTTAEAKAKFTAWNEIYHSAASGFRTCQLLRRVGSDNILPELQPLIELHDQMTHTELELPLA